MGRTVLVTYNVDDLVCDRIVHNSKNGENIKKENVIMQMRTAQEIAELAKSTITLWHVETKDAGDDRIIVTEAIRKIKPLNEHREDLDEVIKELVITNTEMWHEEDKVRSENDAVVLKAIRNINPLNQHRNDLIEEIDEIITDSILE